MAYPKSFSAYPLFGGTQWPFALKAFRKVDVAGVIHDSVTLAPLIPEYILSCFLFC